jgi:hypothetical protein
MTKITFSDEKLAQALHEWGAEMEIHELDEDSRNVLTQTFKDGWAECFQHNLGPAIELCLLIMRLDKLRRQQGSDGLVVSDQVMQALIQKCQAVVGTAEEGLEDAVEAVEHNGDRAPTVAELVQALLAQMDPMSDDDRSETIGLITSAYCVACGGRQPDTGACSCNNDE